MGQVIKPSVPKGTRDFSPAMMRKRNLLFRVIRGQFERFGFEPVETPAMENLETLTGKYGEEGERLIFKIINSGDFLDKSDKNAYADNNSAGFARSIAKKALRYDLTVPFARFVVQHQNDITFPFRRYQMQPVWRGDRPQKGRYQEFYQCDVDIIGTDSLLSEAELIQIFGEVFNELKLPVTIRFNNRKVLRGIIETIGAGELFAKAAIIIDKLDKIGPEKVKEELAVVAVSPDGLDKLEIIFGLKGGTSDKLMALKAFMKDNETGMKGILESEEVWSYLMASGFNMDQLSFDPLLARGLDYYTGAIFEVVANGVEIGSICGGGRYDDLTGIFGLQGVSGVGISFGIDRIYDAMEELELFGETDGSNTDILFVNFGNSEIHHVLKYAVKLRKDGLNVEVYPEPVKMKKQMKYADAKNIRFVVMAGAEEIKSEAFTLKDMKTGSQNLVTFDQLLKTVHQHE